MRIWIRGFQVHTYSIITVSCFMSTKIRATHDLLMFSLKFLKKYCPFVPVLPDVVLPGDVDDDGGGGAGGTAGIAGHLLIGIAEEPPGK